MKLSIVPSLLALLAIGSSAQAQSCPIGVVDITLEGNAPRPYAPYPSYNLSVPDDGSTVEISKSAKQPTEFLLPRWSISGYVSLTSFVLSKPNGCLFNLSS